MIHISQAQFVALDAAVDDVHALAAWLARRWPDPFDALDPRQRADMAAVAFQRARAWGARSRAGGFAFAGLMAEFAADFDRHPVIAAELNKGSGDNAVFDLPKRVGDEAWDQARLLNSSIGWRLEAPMWSADPRRRVAAAVGRAVPASAPMVQDAVREAMAFAPRTGDQPLFVLSLAVLLDGAAAARQRFETDLQHLGAPRLAIAATARAVTARHGVWA